jgi:hypothetical protein
VLRLVPIAKLAAQARGDVIMNALRDWLGWRGTIENINGFKTHVSAAVGHYPGFAVVETEEGLICCRMEQEEDGWLYTHPEGVAPNRARANAYLEHRGAGSALKSCLAEGCCESVVDVLGAAFTATFKMEQRKNDGRATRVQMVTYSDDPEFGVFCELLLPDGERLSISVERNRVAISKLEARGAAPGTTLWESSNLVAVASRFGCTEPSPGALLSTLKSAVVECESAAELERKWLAESRDPAGDPEPSTSA